MIMVAGVCLFANAQQSLDENFRQGLLALKENRYEEALSKLIAASNQPPQDAKIHNFLGITLASLRRNEQAIAEYRTAIHLDPTPSGCLSQSRLSRMDGSPTHFRLRRLEARRRTVPR